MDKVTVVTVVLNDREGIETTILSTLDQTYPHVEFILVDGGSSDGTEEIIQSFRPRIDRVISEPDRGIYDAMNKGIELATGDWIFFLNSGDSFFSKKTLKEVFSREYGDHVLFGNHLADYGYFQRIHQAGPLSDLRKGMVFSHQAMFVRTQMMKAQPFRSEFVYCADYEFVYSLYREGASFCRIPQTLTRLRAGGVSEKNIHLTYWERWRIARRYESYPKLVFFDLLHAGQLFLVVSKMILKAIIPNSWVRGGTRWKYRVPN